MAAENKPTRRINVTFPTELLTLLDVVIPSGERNRFIVEATERSLRRERLHKLLIDLRDKPAWSESDHPDLVTTKDVEHYIHRLRETWMPYTWDEIVEQGTEQDGINQDE